MYQEILINVESQERRVAILEDRVLEEFYVEREDAQKLVGSIYRGIVNSIVPAIGAAFVDIGLKKNGFLYVQDLTQPDFEKMAELIDKPHNYETKNGQAKASPQININDMLKASQEVLVQVVKEPLGAKGARLTTHISLAGRYLVLMPCDDHLGISRRIQDGKERIRLKELLRGLRIPPGMGLIVRTVAQGVTKRELLQDLGYLMNLWRKIKSSIQKRPAPYLIHEEYDLILRIIRDNLSVQTNKLIVDSKEEYKRIMRFLGIIMPKFKNRVQFYQQDTPLFEKRGVEDEITKIYERKVLLKSGGHIMIEPTEGLVAIDVNSGRFTGKKDPEENAYLVNLEAAREIARQARLRDIGGIIIIDFIDMKSAQYKKRVFDTLNGVLKRDHAKTDISTVSEFGLIEMTRQRVRKSFESVVYQSCPYCQGKGLVKSVSTMAILTLREMRKTLLQKKDVHTLLVFAHPNVATHLANEDRLAIYNLENKFRAKILIKADASLHIQTFKLEVA